MTCTQEDMQVLKEQLGREPRNVVKVSKRCSANHPQVIVTAPILEQENDIGIFPTTFWLTCPELNYRISKLEDEGWIQKIQDQLNDKEELAQELEEAHQSYAEYRLNLMPEQKQVDIADKYPNRYRVLKESGVGGILEFAGIKCLHTHYAHYLATENNPIGRLTNNLLKDNFEPLDTEDCLIKCEKEE
ncbi:DUF501 domain-containing protein [Halanaerocella petrolearia]